MLIWLVWPMILNFSLVLETHAHFRYYNLCRDENATIVCELGLIEIIETCYGNENDIICGSDTRMIGHCRRNVTGRNLHKRCQRQRHCSLSWMKDVLDEKGYENSYVQIRYTCIKPDKTLKNRLDVIILISIGSGICFGSGVSCIVIVVLYSHLKRTSELMIGSKVTKRSVFTKRSVVKKRPKITKRSRAKKDPVEFWISEPFEADINNYALQFPINQAEEKLSENSIDISKGLPGNKPSQIIQMSISEITVDDEEFQSRRVSYLDKDDADYLSMKGEKRLGLDANLENIFMNEKWSSWASSCDLRNSVMTNASGSYLDMSKCGIRPISKSSERIHMMKESNNLRTSKVK